MECSKLLFSCACSVLVFFQNMEALTVRTPTMAALDPVLEVIQDVDVTLPGETSVQGSVDDLVLASEEFASSEKAPLSSIEKVKEHYRDLRVCLESLIQEGTASDKLIRASKIRRDLIDILLLTEAPSLPLFQQAVFQGWSAYFKAYVSWLVEGVSIEVESLGEWAQVHLGALKEASKEFKGFLLLLKELKSDSYSP